MPLAFDLVDLQLFVHVMDTQSLTRGAEYSHLSSPAASARIKKLEEALGRQLFQRTAQGLSPTADGREVLQRALDILQQAKLLAELFSPAAGLHGSIRLYTNTLALNEFVPLALQRILLDSPGLSIDLHERSSVDIVRALKQGTADIGIFSADIPTEGLHCLPYRTERLILVTSRAHPLSYHQAIEFSDTLSFDYIGLQESSALHAFLQRAAEREGVFLQPRIRAGNFEALCHLVAAGIGIGVVPESVAKRHAEHLDLVTIALSNSWAQRDLCIGIRSVSTVGAPVKELMKRLVLASLD